MNYRVCIPAFCYLAILGCAAGLAARASRDAGRLDLALKLYTGQTLRYSIDYETETHGNTASVIQDPQALRGMRVKVHGLVRVVVLEVKPEGVRSTLRLRATFDKLNSDTDLFGPSADGPSHDVQRMNPEGKAIEFTLGSNGRVSDLIGMEALYPEQQQAWLDWLAQFATTATLPVGGAKRGQKWEAEQTEGAPTILTGLLWVRKSQYARNEPCRAVNATLQGVTQLSQEPEACAILLTSATLRQKSSPNDATPEAFRLRDLRTSGTVRGSSEFITYVSINTGLVVRSTATGRQTLDVTVAKTDRSNEVHYKADVKSRSEIQLVAETPLARP